ncbi:MAG TPA: flagellin [Patescibacteria group bacterium]|nr:flagellin [Patescibacteria group bacterium]
MTSVSTIAQSQTQLENLQKLLLESGILQNQAASGKKAQTFAGLGSDALSSLQSRTSLNALTAYDQNITNGQTRLNIMTSAVTSLKQQAQSMISAMEGEIQNGNFDMTALHSLAVNALTFIKNLLDTQDGSQYVFAGADNSSSPFNDSGALDTYAQTSIDSWVNGTITTDQFINTYQSRTQLTDTIMGFSAPLASGQAKNVFIKADTSAEIDYTVLANDPSLRDLVATATMLVNITAPPPAGLSQISGTPGDPSQPPGATTADQSANFYKVFNNLIATMSKASSGIDQLSSKLGYAQANLKTIQEDHTLDENVLKTNISNAEDVDLNEVATKLSSLQTQLQASYQITASLSKFSLAFILPV